MRRAAFGDSERRARALAEEAASLVTADRALDAGWLASAAGWLGETAPSWEEATGDVPAERSYHRLVAAIQLEAWLICWPRDGRLQLHDHGGAAGALHVVQGALDERSATRRSRRACDLEGSRVRLASRIIPAGSGLSFDGDYVHDVRNTERTPATSVHIYGPAQRPMAFYRIAGGRLEMIEGLAADVLRADETAARSEDAGARAAHPSVRSDPRRGARLSS